VFLVASYQKMNSLVLLLSCLLVGYAATTKEFDRQDDQADDVENMSSDDNSELHISDRARPRPAARPRRCRYRGKWYNNGRTIFTDNTYPMPCYKLVCTSRGVRKHAIKCTGGCMEKRKKYKTGQVIFVDDTLPEPCYRRVCTSSGLKSEIMKCPETTTTTTTTSTIRPTPTTTTIKNTPETTTTTIRPTPTATTRRNGPGGLCVDKLDICPSMAELGLCGCTCAVGMMDKCRKSCTSCDTTTSIGTTTSRPIKPDWWITTLGLRLRRFEVKNNEQCTAACEEKRLCNGTKYYNKEKICELYRGAKGTTRGVVTGFDVNGLPTNGSNIAVQEISTSKENSAQQCQAICKGKGSKCNMFKYDRKANSCALYVYNNLAVQRRQYYIWIIYCYRYTCWWFFKCWRCFYRYIYIG